MEQTAEVLKIIKYENILGINLVPICFQPNSQWDSKLLTNSSKKTCEIKYLQEFLEFIKEFAKNSVKIIEITSFLPWTFHKF